MASIAIPDGNAKPLVSVCCRPERLADKPPVQSDAIKVEATRYGPLASLLLAVHGESCCSFELATVSLRTARLREQHEQHERGAGKPGFYERLDATIEAYIEAGSEWRSGMAGCFALGARISWMPAVKGRKCENSAS